jgi:vancomycin resistance protein YoaR
MTDETRELPETPEMLVTAPRRSGRHREGRPLVAFGAPRVALGRMSWPLAVAGGIVALLVVAILADAGLSWGRIHAGVTVGGVAVGGMDPSAARAVLDRELSPRVKLPVNLVFESRRWVLTASRVGARLPVDDLVVSAYRVGRSGNVLAMLGDRFGTWFGRAQIPAAADADPAKLEAVVAEYGRNVGVRPVDAGVIVSGTRVDKTPAKAGTSLQAARFTSDLLTAFVTQNRVVRLIVAVQRPDVSDADAEQAYRDASRMVAGDVTLSYKSGSWVFGAAEVARWVAFRKVPFGQEASSAAAGASSTVAATGSASAGASTRPAAASVPATAQAGVRMVFTAYVDAARLSSAVTPISTKLGKAARDARFQVSGKTARVVPGQVGVAVDVTALAASLDATLKGAGARSVVITLGVSQPRLTTQAAEAMGIKERISTFTTQYAATSNTPRVNNIHTLANALDGKLVAPGAVFSFNGAVGERTAAKGYQEAPAIVGNKLVPQLGGGICQVGTTIFNAVFFSGFPVLERTNHSFYISHYPKGRDATISWGGPDFKFKNDSKYWVMIHTSQAMGELTVSLYGTNPGYKVAYTTGPFTDIVPYKVTTVKDPTLPLGKTATTGSGVDGRRVVVVRTVTLNGVVLHRDTFVSVYKPQNLETHIGMLPPSKPATATPSPSATGTAPGH